MSTPSLPRYAAAYIRVSTDDQVELSPDSQLEEIRKYAQRENLLLLNDHIYIDAGISGKKAERRPEFMRMIAQAKSEDCPFSVILLWKFSRFARTQEESIFYKSILRSKCGVEVVSVTEPLIAGPFGSLIERIIEWMDEFYSIRLSQEVKRSMTVNAHRGKLQASPSFGYRAEGGKLVPKTDEAAHVRRIFDSFAAGAGLWNIAKELNDQGVRTHRGNRFENRTIEYIIRNPVYIGKLRWNPTGRSNRDYSNENIILADGEHEPLISMEVWEAAQKRMDQVKAQWGYKARPTYELKHWLSGIVRCSSCGGTLIFCKPHYFKCNNWVRAKCNHSQHISADVLAESVIAKLEEDAFGSSSVAYDVTYTSASGGNDLSRLETALKQLYTKKERLQDAYLSGVLELDDFAKAKKGLEASISSTQKQIEDQRARLDKNSVVPALRASIAAALETLRSPETTMEEK
ncbi:MAG: recombinase family protein, partial [Oscillospiraceae bacterium]|nr:recombinase family protein [Oscillospiraceae bacterium]